MAGISNFTIEKFINEIDDKLKKSFIGVFPSDKTLKFLKITEMVRKKKPKYPFMIMKPIDLDKAALTGRVFLKLPRKTRYSFLTVMVLLV